VAALLGGAPQAQHEIKALFAQLEVGPVTPEVVELTAQTIARVLLVVGAGIMGAGIAQVAAQAGHRVAARQRDGAAAEAKAKLARRWTAWWPRAS
jgi:NADPH-dependent 2,4-dienoyl-CoA reductase/sulfur reductase-like enzyme